jgi:hypothetical protein
MDAARINSADADDDRELENQRQMVYPESGCTERS